jgi:hypothetical protein
LHAVLTDALDQAIALRVSLQLIDGLGHFVFADRPQIGSRAGSLCKCVGQIDAPFGNALLGHC